MKKVGSILTMALLAAFAEGQGPAATIAVPPFAGQASTVKRPVPPRTGRNSVQAIFGGRSDIPLTIVPPRTYDDGTEIPYRTPVVIVIYRSHDDGKRGSYTEEVGRAQGQVTRADDLQAWIDVAARVPPGDSTGGRIYLAASAIIAGEESDLVNRWLTIVWSPGSFDVEEYPAAGSEPGPPPSRRVEFSPYPDWVFEAPAADVPPAGSGGVATSPFDQLGGPPPMPRARGEFASALGPPAPGFQSPNAMQQQLVNQQLREHLEGTVTLGVGDGHFFEPASPRNVEFAYTRWVGIRSATQLRDREVYWFVTENVLSGERRGNGQYVSARRPGIGEVWCRSFWRVTDDTGTEHMAYLDLTWLVLIGNDAIDAYRGKRSEMPAAPPGVLTRGTIRGLAVLADGGLPVADAQVFLILQAGGKSYTLENWRTGSDGRFLLQLSASLAGGGLPEGSYEVMVQKRSANVANLGPANDLWPAERVLTVLNRGRLADGSVDVGTIRLKPIGLR